MGSCKECYHYEVCRMHYQQKCELTYETEKEVRRAMLEAEKGNPICDHFKDRSRFVELPCKVGDTLFVPTRKFISEYEIEYFHFGKFGIWFNTKLTKGISTRLRSADIKDIGKTVFLTREEAERALKLKEREGGA